LNWKLISNADIFDPFLELYIILGRISAPAKNVSLISYLSPKTPPIPAPS
jgi:hypothetical protein